MTCRCGAAQPMVGAAGQNAKPGGFANTDNNKPDSWQEARHIEDTLLSGCKLCRQQLKVGLLRLDFLVIL